MSASDTNIQILLTAVDKASAALAQASEKIKGELGGVEQASASVEKQNKRTDSSMKDFAVGASGAATAAFSFYSAYDRIEESGLRADRANLMVKNSTKTVEEAEQRLSAIRQKTPNDIQAIADAERDLSLAKERQALTTEQAQQADENHNQAMIATALQVIPTTITMIDSLGKAYKNLPDISGMLTNMGTKITDTGNKAAIAAIGVTAFVGGFTLGYTAMQQFGSQIGPVGRAVAAIVPAIIAAAAAVWMLQEGWTLGVATAALIAAGVAVGAMVSNLQSYGNVLGLAEGGIVRSKAGGTLALIGEAGKDEIVQPLDEYEAQRAQPTKTASNGQPQIVNIGGVTMQFYGDIADAKYLEDAAAFTADKISTKVSERLGGG